ncbi:hypothetical protein [Desulfonema magnum]|nr:hypothetical protein [Desulfonema magnum]
MRSIFCAGDVGQYQFTHAAATRRLMQCLFGSFKSFQADYRLIPWATYTDPEVARGGLNESDAKEGSIPFTSIRHWQRRTSMPQGNGKKPMLRRISCNGWKSFMPGCGVRGMA